MEHESPAAPAEPQRVPFSENLRTQLCPWPQNGDPFLVIYVNWKVKAALGKHQSEDCPRLDILSNR